MKKNSEKQTGMNLQSYDMIWAITQDTLNTQIQNAFNKIPPGDNPPMGQVKFGDLDKAGFEVDGLMKPPAIAIEEGAADQVNLTISFVNGTFTHKDFAGNVYVVDLNPKTNPSVDGLALAFKANLNIADMPKMDCSKKPPQNMDIDLYNNLCKFVSSDFSISQIFLDLQNADAVTFLQGKSTIPQEADATEYDKADPSKGRAVKDTLFRDLMPTFFQVYIEYLAGNPDKSPYIFGYTAIKPGNQASALQPTGSVFSTFYNSGNPDYSTLNFLMMTDNGVVNQNPSPLSSEPVVPPSSGDGPAGTGYIANDKLATDWLQNDSLKNGSVIHSIGKQLGIDDDRILYHGKDGFTGSQTNDLSNPPSVDGCTFNSGTSTPSFSITFSNTVKDDNGDTFPGLIINGQISVVAHYTKKDLYHCNLTATLSSSFSFGITIKPGIGNNSGSIILGVTTPQIDKGTPDFRYDSEVCQVFDAVFDLLTEDLLGLIGVINITNSVISNIDLSGLQSNLATALDNLQCQVVLPAPETFIYQTIALDDNNDLIVDFHYNS